MLLNPETHKYRIRNPFKITTVADICYHGLGHLTGVLHGFSYICITGPICGHF